MDERADRALEFVKSTRSTASKSHSDFQGISGTFCLWKKCAEASLRVFGVGFVVERAERALGFVLAERAERVLGFAKKT